MLTWEPTMQVHALHAQGWTISAIARHGGINRRTVRAYLAGREPGRRVSPRPEAFTPYAEYVRLRLTDDPHVWASTLFDEVRDLGYAGGYQSFTRGLRAGRLRPHCEPCAASRGRDHAIIDHPPGEETLCGIPHKNSYGEPGNMRRQPRKPGQKPIWRRQGPHIS